MQARSGTLIKKKKRKRKKVPQAQSNGLGRVVSKAGRACAAINMHVFGRFALAAGWAGGRSATIRHVRALQALSQASQRSAGGWLRAWNAICPCLVRHERINFLTPPRTYIR